MGRLGYELVCVDEHHVAREYGRVLVPLLPHGRNAPAKRRAVHNVVVHKSEGVEHFKRGGGGEYALVHSIGEERVAAEAEPGSYPLAAYLNHIPQRVVQAAGLVFELKGVEKLFDGAVYLAVRKHSGKCVSINGTLCLQRYPKNAIFEPQN